MPADRVGRAADAGPRTADFDFDLPPERIAQHPARPRDAARLLHVAADGVADRMVRDLPALLRPGDVLVANDTRVILAQLTAWRGAARIGITLDQPRPDGSWHALARNARRLRPGDVLRCDTTTDTRPPGTLPPETSQTGIPQTGIPQTGIPQTGTPQTGTPQTGTPQTGTPQTGTPRTGTPQTETPRTGTPLPEAPLLAEVLSRDPDGGVMLRFSQPDAPHRAGALALPPYIRRPAGPTEADATDYQTVFAAQEGAVAAPTAGLHFTPALLAALDARGVHRVTITLHVGAGTFLPVREADVARHRIHAERGEITPAAAAAINAARQAGGRIVAVGTTSTRLLESATDASGLVHPFAGDTSLFLLPGHRFRAVDLLMTNFHLPRSTLFMLVCAFAGRERMRAAYDHAIATGYRFYSYGDACLLEPCALRQTKNA